ncbi:MAG TPA: aminoglycoside phosphotransferase [Clostridiales bacterium]|nr:aminoglycoside phosphotransferase [Clostridiales bacterium]
MAIQDFIRGKLVKSKTKSLLSIDQINELVRINFGDDCQTGSIQELEGGMFNAAYMIERVNEHDKIVLKVSLAPETQTLSYEKDPMTTEIEVYRLIGQHTSIPTPRILAVDFSKQHIPCKYFFMTALEGIVMYMAFQQMTAENLTALKIELADYFAQFHQIKGSYFGYFTDDPAKQFKTWRSAYTHMMDQIIADGRRLHSDLPYDRIERAMDDNAHYLDDIKVPCLVNFDLWPGNIYVVQKNGNYVIEGIYDFERAFWGDPLADFTAIGMIARDLHHDPDIWNTYKIKSGIENDLTQSDDIRFALYSIYIYTIMVVETFRYDDDHRNFQLDYSNQRLFKNLDKLDQLSKNE